MKKIAITFASFFMLVSFVSSSFTQMPGLDPISLANKLLEPLAIEFPFDKYKLPGSELMDKVAEIAPAIKGAIDKIPAAYKVYIVGHTDSTGGKDYNKSLAGARARIVYWALVKNGVPKKNLEYVSVWNTAGAKRAVTFQAGKAGSMTQK